MRILAAGMVAAVALGPGLAWGQMQFVKRLVEIEAPPDGDVVEAEFPFVVGPKPAVIAEYDAPCTCLEAQISDGGRLEWKAGEKGTVKGIFKLGTFKGAVDKMIVLRMKGETVPSVQLTVRVTIPELVQVEPRTLFWTQGGSGEAQSFRITMNGEKPIHIVESSGTNDQFPFKLKTLEEGRRYELEVTPTTVETRAFGLIKLGTDSEYTRHQRYQCFVVIRPAVHAPE
jgi:hypothetical protein